MYGCFVTEPEDDGADLGVVFFHDAGYSTACGHGTIALVTSAVERRHGAEAVEPETARRHRLSLRDGWETVARVEDGTCGRPFASRNVPAYVDTRGLEAAGHIVDVAYGGAFYAFLEERVAVEELPRLIELGRARSPTWKTGTSSSIRGARAPRRLGVVFWQHEDDGPPPRSAMRPCSPTARSTARLAAAPLLRGWRCSASPSSTSQRHRHGATARRIVGRKIGRSRTRGVVTEVEGSAHRTGAHEFVLENERRPRHRLSSALGRSRGSASASRMYASRLPHDSKARARSTSCRAAMQTSPRTPPRLVPIPLRLRWQRQRTVRREESPCLVCPQGWTTSRPSAGGSPRSRICVRPRAPRLNSASKGDDVSDSSCRNRRPLAAISSQARDRRRAEKPRGQRRQRPPEGPSQARRCPRRGEHARRAPASSHVRSGSVHGVASVALTRAARFRLLMTSSARSTAWSH